MFSFRTIYNVRGRIYLYLWHARNLLGPVKGRSPWSSVANKELTLGGILLLPFWIINHSRLKNNGTGERLAGTEESGTTVGTEVGSDALASISGLGDCLWRACTKIQLERLQMEVKRGRIYQ
jgi:hypothetical protein